MRTRRIAAITASAAALTGGGLWLHQQAQAKDRPAYRTVAVEKGDLEATVSATGNLAAVRTVQVGTQVSGQIAQMEVDFNQQVKKGQLLARIDSTLARQAVADAQASLDRSQAELVGAQKNAERNKMLLDEGLVARSTYDDLAAQLAVARANVSSARVAVERARQNLSYTEIHSPIDGVVVERNADVGQTVAASLSTPQLFLIANDLTHMQIVVSVDESDIASIQEGQPVRFTVQARPSEKFTGRVEQVRLKSTTTENVVSYDVVVSAENKDSKLLPGMTARVEFLVQSATDVLKVANAALRFKPEAGSVATAPAAESRQRTGTATDTERAARWRQRAASRAAGTGAATGTAAVTGRPSGARGKRAQLWTVDGAGRLKAVTVRTGITDGVMTQVSGEGLEAGTQVVSGLEKTDAAARTSTTANPLQPQRGGAGGAGRRAPGGF
jgi:HlyD family secretion protein